VTGRGQSSAHPNMLMTDTPLLSSKPCAYCLQDKPLSEFRRRTGKRSKGQSRRGACRDCRKKREAESRKTTPPPSSFILDPQPAVKPKPRSSPIRSRSSSVCTTPSELRPPRHDPQDSNVLIPSAQGMILMRGHSDKGRRWHQEVTLELAVILVKEHAAVVVNRRTIRRLYSNKDFRSCILKRDQNICHFCGLYGDTIDHLLPRAKGGHTTPVNCVCACNLCNQTKADQYVEEFMGRE